MCTGSDDDRGIPEEFCCPITREIFRDPVLMKDGRTYEREAIAEALRRTPTSPISREPLAMSDAVQNLAIKNLVSKFLAAGLQIRVRVPGEASELQVTVRRGDAVATLKTKIAQQARIPVQEQILTHNGVALNDKELFVYSGVCDGDCVEVACRSVPVLIKESSTRTFTATNLPHQKVIDLKKLVETKWGIPPSVQALVYHGRPLQDDDLLGKYRIAANSTIYVTGRLLGGAA
jgi:hypothetical protein